MLRLFRFLFGYVKFTYTKGFCEDFLNLCREENIHLWRVRRLADGLCAVCSVRTYKRLHRLVRTSGGVTKIYRKAGLPFILPIFNRRLGFFTGALAFVMIIALLSSFVWNVDIVGCENISEATVEDYLKQNGLAQGAMWGVIDREKIAWQMLADFDSLSWAHINKDGAHAVVELREAEAPQEEYDENILEGINAFRKTLETTAQREQSSISLAGSRNYYTLSFFMLKIPLYTNMRRGDITASSTKNIKILSKELPVGVTVTTQQSLESKSYLLNDGELEALVMKKLKDLEALELDEYEIVSASYDTSIDESSAKAQGNYVLRYR